MEENLMQIFFAVRNLIELSSTKVWKVYQKIPRWIIRCSKLIKMLKYKLFKNSMLIKKLMICTIECCKEHSLKKKYW